MIMVGVCENCLKSFSCMHNFLKVLLILLHVELITLYDKIHVYYVVKLPLCISKVVFSAFFAAIA